MTYMEVIDEVSELEHFREWTCSKCGAAQRTHVLQIYGVCTVCGVRFKLRGLAAIGTEIEDVIDAVLEWMGEGEALEATMARWRGIQEDSRRQAELERREEEADE